MLTKHDKAGALRLGCLFLEIHENRQHERDVLIVIVGWLKLYRQELPSAVREVRRVSATFFQPMLFVLYL
jgi:hypothetical protein